MDSFQPTIILRHRRENLKKCSLAPLINDPRFHFYTYPHETDSLSHRELILLGFDGPILSYVDARSPLLILDATWRYANTMAKQVAAKCKITPRSLPSHFETAYPRRQEDCALPNQGLASIEAIYIAYHLMGRSTEALLDGYYWKENFLRKNSSSFNLRFSQWSG